MSYDDSRNRPRHVAELGLSVRVANGLMRAGIYNETHLADSLPLILSIPNFGRTALAEIEALELPTPLAEWVKNQ